MFEAIIFYFRPVSHSFKISNSLQCYLFLECLSYVVVFLFYLASASIYNFTGWGKSNGPVLNGYYDK